MSLRHASPDSDDASLDLVILGGAGHVGLPLSLSFARAGLHVGIVDTDANALRLIEQGTMPFLETDAQELLHDCLRSGRLHLSSQRELLGQTDQILIVIGTPIDEFLNPSLTMFERALIEMAPYMREDSLLVLRSTVYPGTTVFVRELMARLGRRADIAFCPERIAEGKALEELATLPQIVGADDQRAADRAASLFQQLGLETIQVTSLEAELAKLFTNAWRYMKFAIANQFFMIANSAGADYNRVLEAVRHNYPRAQDLPGPGFAAGPCLLKDTMQLASFTADHFPMGQSAMQINEGLPAYIVAALEQRYGSIEGRTVGILGMAFKAESDDPRASLSYKLRKLISWAGATVLCTDPYVQDARLQPLQTVLQDSDMLILGAPHQAYSALDVGGKDVVDVWGILGGGIRL
ncbi:MAG TPA: nucleotide sugar dehydrogenase [Dehalococcoidia bacterium]|nr:nucleotide sugar dehydrogenase [Dehalococcoidia bacterium]